jgi:hypothetical protein
MKFTNITKIGSLLVVSAALLASAAKATPIGGVINFAGAATVTGGSIATATGFSNFAGVTVVPLDTGNYAGTAGLAATFSPFSFSSTAVTPLWTFTWGAVTYSFDSTGPIDVSYATVGKLHFLNISGDGIANETGFTSTPGVWSITATVASSSVVSFGFAASSTVPDSGATALLIALGLAGIAVGVVAQRKLVRA